MTPCPRIKRVIFQFALLVCLAAPARSEPVITEFVAANARNLADADGDFPDWIELRNPDAAAVNLAGWYLTDDAKDLTKWQFPAVTLPAGGYLIVFASDKNRRDPEKELHTNFALDAEGEYLGLIMPDGQTVVSQFAPKFPAQMDDVSYGTTQPGTTGEAPRTGYFRTPTPGARNGGADTLLLLERVTLSRASGPFTGAVSLTLSGAAEGQRIRYVVAPPAATGATVPEPDAAADEYTGPITIGTSAIVRAAVFSADNIQRGFSTTGHYVRLATAGAARVDTFASRLPLLVIDTHGSGALEKDGVDRPAWLYAWNRPAAGGTALTTTPTATSPLTTAVRGSSSAFFPKKGYNLRLTNSAGKDNPLPLYGLAAFDRWALVGPWGYDPTFLHNVLIYDLSNRIGRWAPRTQLVEVFFNADGGDLDNSDYAGIYILTDALRVDKKRIDIAELGPKDVSGAAVTGGYLLKFDVPADDDFSFKTRRNYPGAEYGLIVTSPNAADLVTAQRDYIKGYVQSFEDALYADSEGGWRGRTHLDYMDRDSWVDHHILNTLSMSADAFVRSAYLMKDRRGRLAAGPVWDYDRALGGGDPRTQNPTIWHGDDNATDVWNYGWWGILVRDPEFMQAWIDRWQKLRQREFSSANLAALIDAFAAQIGPAAASRDAARWPDNASRFVGGWQGEIDNLKSFVAQRSAWIDSKFVATPTVTNTAGMLTVRPAPGTQLAYTTDGTDPRALGGGVSSTARLSSAPVTLSNALNLQARSYRAAFNPGTLPGSPWSSALSNPGRLINLSILTELAASDTFTMGFVVGGPGTSGPKALLARAAGPSLAQFGVTGAHTDPKLEFFAGTTKLTENDNWGGAASISNAFAQVGAFAYNATTSKDAAVFDPAVAPGNNSVVVAGIGSASGTVIAELYDATPAATVGAITSRLVNVSVLKHLGVGLTAGFVIGDGSAKTVLIRAIGPTLGTVFGVDGVVADPQLTLFGANSTKIGENDDWGGTPVLAAAFASVGAFALPTGSRDAALLATLAPGNYTVQVRGEKTTTGVALVEVYEVP
ncbi:MAG: CotH kinase family protein [Verrucomicrobia bacterium]|nr:CotH kinase family protein [Verrucomicrobiota bacterium]